MVRAMASNICRRSFGIQSVGQLRVEIRAPRVEADAESQDLQAHRAWGVEVWRLLGREAAGSFAVASGHVPRQRDTLGLAYRIGEEELQQHLVSKLDRRDF